MGVCLGLLFFDKILSQEQLKGKEICFHLQGKFVTAHRVREIKAADYEAADLITTTAEEQTVMDAS